MPARLLFFVVFVCSSFSFAQDQQALYICHGSGEVIKVEVIESRIELNGDINPVVEFKISHLISKSIEQLVGQDINMPSYSVKLDDQGAVTEVSEQKMFGSTLTCIQVNKKM